MRRACTSTSCACMHAKDDLVSMHMSLSARNRLKRWTDNEHQHLLRLPACKG